MTIKDLAFWWAIAGLITCLFGAYRHLKGKTDEPGELVVLGWFFFPMIFLPVMIIKQLFLKPKK